MTTSTDFLTQSMRASLAAIIRDAALKFEKLALLPDSARPNRAMDTVHEMRRRGNYHAFLHSLAAMLRLSESLHVMHGGQCAQSLLQPTVHYQRRMLNQSGTSSANTAATTGSSSRAQTPIIASRPGTAGEESVKYQLRLQTLSILKCLAKDDALCEALRCSGPRNGACEALSSAATQALSTAALKFERPDLRARLLERCECARLRIAAKEDDLRVLKESLHAAKIERTASMDSIRLGKINMYERELGLSRKEESRLERKYEARAQRRSSRESRRATKVNDDLEAELKACRARNEQAREASLDKVAVLRRKVLKSERELAALIEKYDERALHLHREMEQVSKSHEHIRSEIAMLTRNVEREERVQHAVREEMERLAEIRRQEELHRSQEAAARSIQKHARGYVARKSIALLKAEASAKTPARKGRRR
eukprot:g1891.t1